jgi:SagB-type dehydrogenase family enzyme
MKRVDLPIPVPRRSELSYSEFKYVITDKYYLPAPKQGIRREIGSVLLARRTRRVFKSISLNKLSLLLWYSARAISVADPSAYSRWQRRPAPSAGGRHPIDLLVLRKCEGSWQIYLYDPVSHAISNLALRDDTSPEQFINYINQVVPVGQATVIWFGAQFDRTMAKYKNGESLVWRDAGALISVISIVAEAIEMNSCAVGVTGEPWLSNLLNSSGKVLGAGGMLVGCRP